ncbi:hypothetical protein Sjap_026237 [Stephania japonica]|uniref:Uncharacterized protein n=1 Tax=Stephania japonica TaxID=461633 RepID=A0AAP0E380_9MAGN
MIVRETLAFSARVQGVGAGHAKLLLELSRREKEANIKPDPDLDLFMKAAALDGQEASVITDYIIKVQVIKMLGKSMKILEVDKRSLMLSSSLTVAVVVNGSRKSNCALKWALERFSDEGKVMFKLLHVRARITTVPTPSPYTSEADGSTKYESSDTISCTDSDFTYDTSSQTGFGAWGCFAFGEDTKDIITTNLEKLLLCFQSGDLGATHLALLILPTGHAIRSSVSALLWQVPRCSSFL